VREDPVKKGLLFAGTELGVFFSTNDGDSWQPLQLNLPVTPVHDLVIKDNDLVIATHGRSFWILDDISPLRQITAQVAASPAHLFVPATALRIRANTNHDTPLPPEEPAGENPPPGAIFYYYLKSPAQEVKLEILDSKGQVVRAYSSKDQPFRPPAPPAFPMYWFNPAEPPSTSAGMHRLVWDIRYTPPPVTQPGYSMSTAYGSDTPREPEGPQALPGDYHLRLTVDGRSYTEAFKMVMDPRVKTSPADLQKQFALELKLVEAIQNAYRLVAEVHSAAESGRISADQESRLTGVARRRSEAASDQPSAGPTVASVIASLSQLLVAMDSADAAPTTQESQAAEKALGQLDSLTRQWQGLKK
jgi:hypothetical protein